MRPIRLLLIPAITTFLFSTQVSADDAQERAMLCSGCHGMDGISLSNDIPNLAGQKKEYLMKAIRDYRSKRRNNPTMNAMAGNLSDEDIEILATYFSQLK